MTVTANQKLSDVSRSAWTTNEAPQPSPPSGSGSKLTVTIYPMQVLGLFYHEYTSLQKLSSFYLRILIFFFCRFAPGSAATRFKARWAWLLSRVTFYVYPSILIVILIMHIKFYNKNEEIWTISLGLAAAAVAHAVISA